MPFHPSTRTRALIRTLRMFRLAAPRKRLPRQQQANGIRLDYFNAIRWVCDLARDCWRHEQGEALRALRSAREAVGKHDAGAPKNPYVQRAAAHFTKLFRPTELEGVARKFGKKADDFQREQLDAQVRAAMGVPLAALERPTQDRIPTFVEQNVALIKTVPERYFDRLEKDVTSAFADGTRPEDLASQLADRYDMAMDDARRIARDQIGKLTAQVNEDRQRALGADSYIWRTMNDDRVRDEHADREGEEFEWSDPPEDGHPGEAVQCRCYAEPVFGILADEGEEDEE